MPSSRHDVSLYGEPRHKRQRTETPASISNSLAFNASLSTLISQSKPSSSSSTSSRRLRAPEDPFAPSKKPKTNLFTAHRPTSSSSSRALSNHTSSTDYEPPSTTDAQRHAHLSQKAALYARLQRGAAQAPGDEESQLIDFASKDLPSSSSSSEDEDEDGDEQVTHTDEFGRTRSLPRREALRLARAAAADASLAGPQRPERPANLILGDAVQSEAFASADADRMRDLVEKRDRSASPPPDVHFDARREVRTLGTGFFGFSKDEQSRRGEMEGLAALRRETETKRGEGGEERETERDKRIRERREQVDRKRAEISAKRGKVMADAFLDSLGSEMLDGDVEES